MLYNVEVVAATIAGRIMHYIPSVRPSVQSCLSHFQWSVRLDMVRMTRKISQSRLSILLGRKSKLI